MTHSQNLNLANSLMFAHAKSKPTIMLGISILFHCVIHSIKIYTYENDVFVTWAQVQFICVNELKFV